jgi:hypothetical protein
MAAKDAAALAWLAVALSACSVASSLGVKTSSSSSTAGPGSSSSSGPVASGSPGGSTGDLIAVPDFTGKTLEEARAIARAAGFSTDVEERPMRCDDDSKKADGKITCQDPEPGKPERRYAGLSVAIHKEWKHEGMLVRAQLLPLVGMTPEQAQKRLKELGHTGKLVVTRLYQYVDRCGPNKICGMESEAGIGIADDLIVHINPTVAISAPPD